jgi:hypothetical protein
MSRPRPMLTPPKAGSGIVTAVPFVTGAGASTGEVRQRGKCYSDTRREEPHAALFMAELPPLRDV